MAEKWSRALVFAGAGRHNETTVRGLKAVCRRACEQVSMEPTSRHAKAVRLSQLLQFLCHKFFPAQALQQLQDGAAAAAAATSAVMVLEVVFNTLQTLL